MFPTGLELLAESETERHRALRSDAAALLRQRRRHNVPAALPQGPEGGHGLRQTSWHRRSLQWRGPLKLTLPHRLWLLPA